jgi:GAF domain-containing protein
MNELDLSVDLQCLLIRNLRPDSGAGRGLALIVERVGADLLAGACTIYTIDDDGLTATQRAGTGYQRGGIGTRTRVVPPDQVIEKPAEDEKLGLTGWILSTGKSFLAESYVELARHPHRLGTLDPEMLQAEAGAGQPATELRLATFLGVPLRGVRGEVSGLIKAERREQPGEKKVKPFTVHEQIMLETAARVASKWLAYLEMAAEGCGTDTADAALDRAVTAWAREAIAEAAASEVEMDSFLAFVSQIVAAAMRADACGIYLIDEIDPARRTLTQRAGCGSQEPLQGIRSYPFPTPEQIKSQTKKVGLTAWIAATGESFHAANNQELRSHPHHRGEFDKWNFPAISGTQCGAFLGVPLRIGGRIIGVLKVENQSIIGTPDPRNFPPDALRRFDLLAQDVALAIVRLQAERLPARYQVILAAEPTIFGILQGGMDVRTLVAKVVKDTAALFKARACALFLKEGNRLIQPHWAAVGWATRGPEVREYAIVEPEQIVENPRGPDEKVGLTVWIAATRNKFTARSWVELLMHPHHKGAFDEYNFDRASGEVCESFMGVPLVANDRLVGVLKVETKQKVATVEDYDGREHEEAAVTYFSEQDELVFDLIANSAAIAIENARISEAERMAEQIRNNMQRLLVDLHEFVRDHLWAVETLNQTADLLRREHPNLAAIVQGYADLLQPQVTPYVLNEFGKQIRTYGDFLEGSRGVVSLYDAFGSAMNVMSVSGIGEICASRGLGGKLEALAAQKFFLVEAVRLLLLVFDQVCKPDGDGRRLEGRAALDGARTRLDEGRMRAEALERPERDILLQIVKKWADVIEKKAPRFRPVAPNPYVAGPPIHPLVPTTPGKPPRRGPFFGRRDVFEWVSQELYGALQPPTLVLHGERRMGKTSILLQLQSGDLGESLRDRRDRPLCPVYVNLLRVNAHSTAQWLHMIGERIAVTLEEHADIGYPVPPVPALADFDATLDTFNTYMERVSAAWAPALLLLMLDEFEELERLVSAGHVDASVYGQLRYQMQFLPNVAFILAGTHQLSEVSARYQGLVYNVAHHREVGFLDADDAVALIRQPVAGQAVYHPDAVDLLVRVTHGHPFLLQTLCHRLILEMNRRKSSNEVTAHDVEHAIQRVVRDGGPDFLAYNFEDLTAQDLMLLRSAVELSGRDNTGCTAAALAADLSWPLERVEGAIPHLCRRRLIEVGVDSGLDPARRIFRPTMPLLSLWLLAQS